MLPCVVSPYILISELLTMFSTLLLVTLLQFCNSGTILIPVNPGLPVNPGAQTCLNPSDVFTLEQGCVDRFSNSVCQGTWERLYENEQTGVATCDCEEDFVRVHGRCHQVGTQGPCALNQYLIVQEGVPICNENPCQEQSDVQLPIIGVGRVTGVVGIWITEGLQAANIPSDSSMF